MQVERATSSDLEAVFAMYDEASAWLLARDIHQWPSPFPRGVVRSAFENECLWVGRRDGEIVAALRTYNSDVDMWPEVKDGESLILHGLVTRRVAAGKGAGIEMLTWALGRARELGRPVIRLDCYAGNQKMRDYYEAFGFVRKDDFPQETNGTGEPWLASRFEYKV